MAVYARLAAGRLLARGLTGAAGTAHRRPADPRLARSHYEILGLQPDASANDIKRAYIAQSLEYHPDRPHNRNSTVATEQFRLVADAYRVLSSATARRDYDRRRMASPGATSDMAQSAEHDFDYFSARQAAAAQLRRTDAKDHRFLLGVMLFFGLLSGSLQYRRAVRRRRRLMELHERQNAQLQSELQRAQQRARSSGSLDAQLRRQFPGFTATERASAPQIPQA